MRRTIIISYALTAGFVGAGQTAHGFFYFSFGLGSAYPYAPTPRYSYAYRPYNYPETIRRKMPVSQYAFKHTNPQHRLFAYPQPAPNSRYTPQHQPPTEID